MWDCHYVSLQSWMYQYFITIPSKRRSRRESLSLEKLKVAKTLHGCVFSNLLIWFDNDFDIESKYHRRNRSFWINISTQRNKHRARYAIWVGLTIHNCVLSGTLIFTVRLRFPPGSSPTGDCSKILIHSRRKRNIMTISHTTYPLFMTFLTDSDVFVSLFFCSFFSVMTGISEYFWTILSNSSKQKSISSNINLNLRFVNHVLQFSLVPNLTLFPVTSYRNNSIKPPLSNKPPFRGWIF